MVLLTYIENYVYDGTDIYKIEDYPYLSNYKYIVYNIKEFIRKNKFIFSRDQLIDLQLYDTTFKLNNHDISVYKTIDKILHIQEYNIDREIKYIPLHIIKKFLKEQHLYLSNLFNINETILDHAVIFHRNICDCLIEIENNIIKVDGKETHLNFNIYGSHTGRITHDLIRTDKDKRGVLIEESNIYEFDFKAFDVFNLLGFCGYSNIKDPYFIKNENIFDRNQVKQIFISYLYGSSLNALYSRFRNNKSEVDNVINLIELKYDKLFKFRSNFINKTRELLYFYTPISKVKLKYNNEDNIDSKVINNLGQCLSADIIKIKLILLNNYIKKHNLNCKILFPVYDSIYISNINDNNTLKQITNQLNNPINIFNMHFENTVVSSKIN